MKDLEQILDEKLNCDFEEGWKIPEKVYVEYKEGKLHIYFRTPNGYEPCRIAEPNSQYSLGMSCSISDVNITEQQYKNLYAKDHFIAEEE